jgi:hypothetical protein
MSEDCKVIAQVFPSNVMASIMEFKPYALVVPKNVQTLPVDINSQAIKYEPDLTDKLLLQQFDNTLRSIYPSDLISEGRDRFTFEFDDFRSSLPASVLGWTATTSGSGSSIQSGTYGVNGIERAIGIQQLDTGTTAAGRATLNRAVNQFQLGYSKNDMIWRVALEQLSTPSERFGFVFGFYDSTGSAFDAVDGVYFSYRDDLNGGNWQCVCAESSALTVVDTTIAANTQFNIFKIEVNEPATEAKFYINGVLVATIATNIPSTSGNFTGIAAKIQKSIGTTTVFAAIDYYYLKTEFTSGAR